ncbi:WD repeat-containing protein 37-like isoform X1 [Mizuhopecten yessoensis]|uniref:WD repeat-containing protein 37-like isoform X1 n=1 Tax=Mizuhopecten yessoensis TaxID=6573 RepID=UPI000B45E29B|nr:WD repeat-containing protein 37-like isoform X1 [Mizuhopecten yessoensis]XP_021373933.1 WD repeat-containing protein 37-like isoform X2 [Mizuhopecten yessoensis]XP_021373934.1 WD repeat-containing protein 37-like isoform X1 [Mizuhopecten yessoensis]
MPSDSVVKSMKVKAGARGAGTQRQDDGSSQAIMSRYDSDIDGLLPPGVRGRLNDLFREIEKEFENLYAENLALQDRVEGLTERLDVCSGGEKPVSENQDTTDHLEVNKPKRSASQISQKIKSTYKVSTSKIVSSFRNPSPIYAVARDYRGHRDGVWEVTVARSDQQLIGTASADHTARVWCIHSGTCLLQYQGHQGSVNSIRFHPAQELALTASGDQTAHIWGAHVNIPSIERSHSSGEDDLDGSEKEDSVDDFLESTPEESSLRTPSLELTGHNGVVVSADWMAAGGQVITASWDRTAILYDAESGEQINTLTGHDQELTDVRAHPTQRMVVTSSKDTTFRLWDFRDPNMLVNVFQGHTQPVTSAVFAGSDKVVSGSDDRTIKVWDIKNMRSPISAIRSDSSVNRLSVSQAHNMIAIPHDNRHIRLYDIHGNRIGRLPRSNRQGHTKMVTAVAWADDHPICNLFTCGFDRQVFGWNINIHSKE